MPIAQICYYNINILCEYLFKKSTTILINTSQKLSLLNYYYIISIEIFIIPQKLCNILSSFGEVSERSKEHAWKACVRQPRTEGSNPSLSAIRRRAERAMA